MARLPLAFLIAATLCLAGGVGLGITMGITHDFQLAPVHAHLNLLGWASLALMGLTHRAWPELSARRGLALAQFGMSTASAIMMPVGIWLSIAHQEPGLAIAASLVWMAGVLLFLGLLLALAFRRAPRPAVALQPAE